MINKVQSSKIWKEWLDKELKSNLSLDSVKKIIMWPIGLSVLNFPPRLRKSWTGIMVAGLIPSNRTGEPKSLELYVAV